MSRSIEIASSPFQEIKSTSFMTIKVRHFLLLVTIILCSCGQKASNPTNTDTDPSSLPDSVKLQLYYDRTDKFEYINGYEYDKSVLAKTEENRDTIKLLNFIKANYGSIEGDNSDFAFTPEIILNSTYGIDFNGDSLLDIFYDGPSGGEPNITEIFLNKGDHYEKVFSENQDISKADFSNNKLNSFILMDPGCCADPEIIERYYSISYDDKKPTFRLDKTIGYLASTEKPQEVIPTPIEFTTAKDNVKLRAECYQLDNVETAIYGIHGNAIGTYNAGATGKALGLKKDKNEVWIYAIMDAENKIDSCDFPAFIEQPTALRGWLLKSDTDLK
ncbi:MAG: hypothetical protein IPP51_10425 [Bacteroidetes bacterium]|nr:hypothetical protein [Bacteroidota bacterium]